MLSEGAIEIYKTVPLTCVKRVDVGAGSCIRHGDLLISIEKEAPDAVCEGKSDL